MIGFDELMKRYKTLRHEYDAAVDAELEMRLALERLAYKVMSGKVEDMTAVYNEIQEILVRGKR